jgi:hypothetical protein
MYRRDVSGEGSDDSESRHQTARTPADRALIKAVAEHGFKVTPDQLHDWRGLKLIPSAQEPGAGRGPGRPSIAYPAGTVERVLAICRIQAMEFRVPMRHLAIWLFLFSEEVELGLVRQAFKAEHDRLFAQIPDSPDGPEANEFELNATRRFTRSPLGRRVVQVTGSRSVRKENSLKSIAAGALAYSAMGQRMILDASNVFARALFDDDESRKILSQEVRRITPLAYASKLDRLPDADLVVARNDCVRVMRLVERILRINDVQHARKFWLNLRKLFNFDAHNGMIAVIQFAWLSRRLGYMSLRLTEELNAISCDHPSDGQAAGVGSR